MLSILLSEISMGLGSAIMSYIVRLILFVAIAAIGVVIGIKLRKRKDSSENLED